MELSDLNSVLQRAKRLTDMDASGQMNMIAEQARLDNKMSYNDENIPMVENYDNQYSTQQMVPMQQSNKRKSFLPKEILESFEKNPPIKESNSILDSLMPNQSKPTQPQRVKQVIRETYQPQVVSNSSIDYSLIKDIIETSVKKYMGVYAKKIINELKENNNTDTLKILQIGDTFKFVTEDGELYNASLKYVKNIKK